MAAYTSYWLDPKEAQRVRSYYITLTMQICTKLGKLQIHYICENFPKIDYCYLC